ncbi:transcription intermediary factor 1-beta isoform X1 [Electrophorus electricus]|uniref:transcription intermediary factor 1-beta isoform X1 n=2 Tax=Electrophorus electricus TaxID=8005 RepID=UPI0015CFE872|nr:transcription intermediary factor 1-beta isoform X1 [Electrophorus electricus]
MFLGVQDQGGEGANVEKESCLELQKGECETCVVCRTKLNSSAFPKLLPCLHPVCKACITNNNDGNDKECPMCGLAFNLSEVTDCFMFMESAPKCGGCDESVPSGWCVQCEEALCSQCVSAHQRVKVTRDHTVTPQDPSSGPTASLRCTSHKQEWLKFLCVTCNELTCRDCQLILHRGHSFLLLEEAVVSLKEQLQKMLHCIREQRNSMMESLLNMDGRLQDIKVLKVASKKKLTDIVHNMYLCLVLRGRELFKEVEGLYDEEEKSLLEMKTNLRKLEERQEYVTAFIHKILRTDSQCILLHKKQIEKQVEGLLSQNTCLNETMIRPTLQLSSEFCKIIKTFGSVKVQKVPLESRRKYLNISKPKEAPKDVDSGPKGKNSKPVAAVSVFGREIPQSSACSDTKATPELPCLVESESASVKPALLLQRSLPVLQASDPIHPEAPGESHGSASSVLARCCPLPPPQSTTAESVAAQVSATLPPSASSHPASTQQVTQSFRTLSHPYPSIVGHASTSLPSQRVLSNFPSRPSQLDTAMLQANSALPPQVGSIPAAVSLSLVPHRPTVQRSISLHTASSQFWLNGSSAFQLLAHNQTRSHSAPTFSTPAPPAQPTQAGSDPQQSNGKVISDHRQHNVHLSQSVRVRSSPQYCQSNSQFPSTPYSGTVPFTQASSNVLPVHLQSSDAAVAQAHPLLFNLLKEPDNNTSCKSRGTWKFHYYTPVPTVNQAISVPFTPNCTVLTTPRSGPDITPASNSSFAKGLPAFKEIMTSWQPGTSNAACSALPVELRFTGLPVISNNEPTRTVSIMPTLSAPQAPNSSPAVPNGIQSEHVSQTTRMPKCEVPVKAPADSLGEESVSVGARASPAEEDPDGNLPTSTVPEPDTNMALPSHPLQDPPFIATVQDCLSHLSSASLSKLPVESVPIPTPTENASAFKPKNLGFPVSFRQILEQTASPTSQVDGEAPDDVLPRSVTEWASPTSMQQGDEEEEVTDISDSEPVEEVYEAIKSEGSSKLTADTNRSLWVSLPRLPISLPATGSPLPQFRIAASGQTAEILLTELKDGQPTQRCFIIPASPETISLLQSQSPGGPLLDGVLQCAVCLSAGALLLCAECGRSFHSECHVPPDFKHSEVWMCSLCQNVLDGTDPFSHSRLKEPYLSIQDQRRCEQLLLTLMCEEHSYLLYRKTKQSRRCVGFEFIVGRLLGKRSPPYRSAAELVSDIWALFDILFISSKMRDFVIKLQRSFQERLNITFGESLHASLLKPPSSEDQKGMPEPEVDRNDAKNTLKRMKAFFAANSGAKKRRTARSDKD